MSPLGPPPADFIGFPRWTLPTTRALYRVHRRDHGPWYFDDGSTGRFNLSGAFGTCYLALVPEGAFLETLGRQGRLIDPAEVARRALSTLRVPRPMVLANTGHARARAFGITAAPAPGGPAVRLLDGADAPLLTSHRLGGGGQLCWRPPYWTWQEPRRCACAHERMLESGFLPPPRWSLI